MVEETISFTRRLPTAAKQSITRGRSVLTGDRKLR